MITRNRKVQPRVLMSRIIVLCRLGRNDRTNLLIFDCECDNTCNLTPTLCIILLKKKSHCLINRDRSLSGGIADCISSNTWIHIPHHTLSRLLILSDKTFKAHITLSCEEPLQFCPWRASLAFALNNGVILTELCSHNNHPSKGTCYCVSHSC